MNPPLFIDLSNQALKFTRRQSIAEQLYRKEKRKPKAVTLLTYTLAPETIDWLNELVDEGVDVLVFAGNLPNSELRDCKFNCRLNKFLHAKAIIFNNKKGWLLTTNAVADTMINLAVALTKAQVETLRSFTHSLLFGKVKHQTYFL